MSRPGAKLFLIQTVFSLVLLLFYNQFKGDKIITSKDITAVRIKADSGDAAAQAYLAHSYLFGTGGQQYDLKEGYRLARLAAEKGDGHAQYLLANIYAAKGLCAKAAEAAQKSSDLGATHGDVFYGAMLTRGWCTRWDEAEAVRYWRKAAVQESKGDFLHDVGVINAQHNMAISYWYGEGVRQDRMEALKWYVKSALNGGPGAAKVIAALIVPWLLAMFLLAYIVGFFEKMWRRSRSRKAE